MKLTILTDETEKVMKKTIMALCVFFALTNNVRGNEYAVGIEARLGVSGLRMGELVYADSSGDRLISEIDWDMGAQMAAGAGLYIGPKDPFRKIGFSAGGFCAWYFPVNDRNMKDSDWDDDGEKLAYGESIASALAGMSAEGRITALFPLREKYVIEAMAEVWYGRHAVVAHDGWTSWANEAETIPLYGTAIEYIQEWIAVAPGIGIRRKLKNAHIGVQVALSPFIWGYHIDNHYFRKLESGDPDQHYLSFIDNTRGGMYYRVQGDWQWNITPSTQAGIALQYRAIKESRGDTTVKTAGLAGYSFFEKETAGANIRHFSVDVTIRTLL
jgi:outer membrane protease